MRVSPVGVHAAQLLPVDRFLPGLAIRDAKADMGDGVKALLEMGPVVLEAEVRPFIDAEQSFAASQHSPGTILRDALFDNLKAEHAPIPVRRFGEVRHAEVYMVELL